MTKILIVEDDELFSNTLREVIERDPELQVVDVINNEEEALKRVRSPAIHDCDCVLLDLQLPFRTGDKNVSSLAGIRILEELRHQQGFYGTIIVLTNSKAPADGQRALAAGCDGYLCKRAKISEVPQMLSELKMAIKGEVILVASQMRHVFIRDDISAKEARMLDLLAIGKSWAEIARELGYKTPKAAANVGDRVFDKILSPQDVAKVAAEGLKKRHKALEIWNSRRMSHAR
ncbi:MAG: response regulator transcription factor [Candidatus Obscuribacterales bacterium]|nr:response regulator transcription factor [Candidatus Obscuribacterales bacterium]